MGKEKGRARYLDWEDERTIEWVSQLSEKHPEMFYEDFIYKFPKLYEEIEKTGYEVLFLPRRPAPPPDGSDWTKFLPGDWDAWLLYYEVCRGRGFRLALTVGDIVIKVTENTKEPLYPTEDPEEAEINDEYHLACHKVNNEFRKARERIKKIKDVRPIGRIIFYGKITHDSFG